MIRLVLTDIDGTILPTGQKRISARTMLAIRNLRRAGIGFGPSSGRERGALFQPFWGEMGLSDTSILANGKVVYVHGRLVRSEALDRGETLHLLEELSQMRDVLLNYFAPHGLDGKGERSYVVVGCPKEDFERIRAERGFGTRRELVDTLPEDARLLSVSIFVIGDPGRIDRVAARLAKACPAFDFLKSDGYTLDVAPHGVNKASALDLVCKELGITRDEVLYLGDSDNDLAMMRACPNSVCMGNGTDGAYEAARWCCGPSSADAVAVILESLVARHGELHPEDWTF